MYKDDVTYMTKFIDKESPPPPPQIKVDEQKSKMIYEREKGLRLAIYQCSSELGDVDANFEKLKFGVEEAKKLNSQLIAFPELFLQGYNPTKELCHAKASTPGDDVMSRISALAKDKEIAILCPYAERVEVGTEVRYYDSMVLYDAKGTQLLNYRKTHLWGPYERSLYHFGAIEESDPFAIAEVNGFRIGVLNCYEAEFPELSRILKLKGAQLLLIPTAADAWQFFDIKDTPPNKGLPYPDVSNTVIPTRAFENNVFCAYVNHCGAEFMDMEVEIDNKKQMKRTKRAEYLGNSVIADPLGNIMLKSPPTQSLLVADLKPADYKKSHPTGTNNIMNRRIDLYSQLVSKEFFNEETGEMDRYPDYPK